MIEDYPELDELMSAIGNKDKRKVEWCIGEILKESDNMQKALIFVGDDETPWSTFINLSDYQTK